MDMLRAEESAVWDMFRGTWSYTVETGRTYTIDYGIPDNHKVTVTTSWGQSGDDPIGDIAAIKRRIERDCGYPISRAYMNNVTMRKFYELPEVSGGYIPAGTESTRIGQLSDAQKQAFQNERVLRRWYGIDWFEYDGGTLAAGIGSAYAPYIPDDIIVFMADGGANDRRIEYGPSIDDDAPADWTGPFTKTWKEQDPSARNVLIEVQYVPQLRNPFKHATLDITA